MRVGIIGTGLIGASIGLRARELGNRVLGYDVDPEHAALARNAGAIDEIAEASELYNRCDVVVLAAHLQATLDELARLRERSLGSGQLVIDIASVKAPVALAAAEIAAFVPTHPMAGGERRGPAAARSDLFANRSWCYVPTADATRSESARAFIEYLGAHALAVDAQEHDRIVALTSHLPQLFAYAFAQCIAQMSAGDPQTVDALCGPVARELLRLGHSSPQMWSEIFEANAPAIGNAFERVEDALRARRISG